METLEIEKQIYLNSSGNWAGSKSLLEHIEELSSMMGILNFELFELVHKEYIKNKDVYDLNHNRPRLLKAKAIALSRKCSHYTEPQDGEFNAIIINAGNPIASSLRRYPMLPVSFLDDIVYVADIHKSETQDANSDTQAKLCIIDQLSPYFNYGDIELTYLKQRIRRTLMMHFYAEWEAHLKEPQLWFNKCIDIVRALDNDKSKSKSFQNVLERELTRMANQHGELNTLMVEVSIPKQSKLKSLIIKLVGITVKQS